MTLTVKIYYKRKDGSARSFAREMVETGVVAEIKAKAGNLKYDYFFPIDDEETVLLIDQWADQAALDAHHDSATMQKILDLREKYDLTMTVERYLVDEAGPTEKDKAFIKSE